MAAEFFPRARGYVARKQPQGLLIALCGGAAGFAYLGWMVLLIFFVELLLTSGRTTVTAANQDWLRQVRNADTPTGVLEDTGLLAAIVDSKEQWYNSFLQTIYQQSAWTRQNTSYLVGLGLLALALALLRTGLLWLQKYALAVALADAIAALQKDIVQHQLSMGSDAFRREVAERVAKLLRLELPRIEEGLTLWWDNTIRERAKIVGLVLLALALNFYLGATFLILAALVWVIGSSVISQDRGTRTSLMADAEEQLGRLLGFIDRLRLLIGSGAEPYFREQYELRLKRYQEDLRRRHIYESRWDPIWQLVGAGVAVGLLTLGAYNVLGQKLPLASAIGVYACLISLAFPCFVLWRQKETLRLAEEASGAVFEFLDEATPTPLQEGSRVLPKFSQKIFFNDITLLDAADRPILDHLHLEIPFGQRIGLVSSSDLDKFALVYLLLRFLDPNKGNIQFDGMDVRDVTWRSLRHQIGLVFAHDLLLPDTVSNNIACGLGPISSDRITEAAKLAHANQFVGKLPGGYDTMIGEKGFPIKAGESYRIALARAMVRDPRLLILEEPTQDLDEDTRSLLDDSLHRFLPGRTALLLARRRSTLQQCDTIILLHRGQIYARGRHADLLAQNKLYRHLDYTQFLPRIISG